MPEDTGGCPFGGIAFPAPTALYTFVRDGFGGVAFHELGHIVGMQHASLDLNSDGRIDENGEYGEVRTACTQCRTVPAMALS
jgi:hypothetical protein